MKKLFLLFTIISTQLLAQYTTPNTGVTWNLDDLVANSGGVIVGTFPNYTMSNKITISANDQINILPGSIVAFNSPAGQFDVNGIFKAVGTATDSIIFTSTTQDSTGFYYGFSFNNSPNDTASIISYARIYYADYGMRCIGASPTLSNSYIYKCGRGFNLSSSNVKILDNVIERCYEYGVTMTLSSSPTIIGNHFIKNNTQGTSAKNQISIGLQGNNSPYIQDNIIEGGESVPTGGISLWVSGASNYSDAVIADNEIFNNSFGITLYSTSDGVVNALVSNNKIYNNNINPNALVSGSGINVNGSSFNIPVIKYNEIYGNWWGITIQNGTIVQAGPNPNIGNVENADTTDDGQNIIYNNIQGTDVFDLYNNCTNDIYAQNNDWRVYDSTAIEGHIFHQVDDPAHGFVKFVPFVAQVPVELTSFAANIINRNISLSWLTSSELNNSGFEILKKSNNHLWLKIEFIGGRGTTTEKSTYSFVDEKPSEGKNYYKLKQIDFDGSFEYSKTIEVDFSLPIEFSLGQNYPNPFNAVTTIKYNIPEVISTEGRNLNVTLKIYDVLGNEIATLVNEEKPAGNYEVNFDASQLTSGVYFYKLQVIDPQSSSGQSFVEAKKMILLR